MRSPLTVFRDRVATPIMEEMMQRVPRFKRVTDAHACCADCGISAAEAPMMESGTYGYLCSACALLSVKFDLDGVTRIDKKTGEVKPVDIQLTGTKGSGSGLLIQGEGERITWYLPPRPMIFEQFIPKDIQIIRSPGQTRSIFQDFLRATLPMMIEGKNNDIDEPFCWAWMYMNNCHNSRFALRKWSLDDRVWLAFFQDKTETVTHRLNGNEWDIVNEIIHEEAQATPRFTKKTISDYVRLQEKMAGIVMQDATLTQAQQNKKQKALETARESLGKMQDDFPWLLDILPLHVDTVLSLIVPPEPKKAADTEAEVADQAA
jgi:hypothetical protein